MEMEKVTEKSKVDMKEEAKDILFQPGDIIIPMTIPFVKVLKNSKKGEVCDNCLEARRLSRCTGCKKMHYCSKACQKDDWKEGHSVECKSELFKKSSASASSDLSFLFYEFGDNCGINMVLRVLAKYKLKPESFSETHSFTGDWTPPRCFKDMKSWPEIELFCSFSSEKEKLGQFFKKKLMKDPIFSQIPNLTEDFFIWIAGVWKANIGEVMDQEGWSKAAGLFIPHSVIGYACRPTTRFAAGISGALQVRCIHPIRKGEKPTVAYQCDYHLGPIERQFYGGFRREQCSCEICLAELKNGPLIDYDRLRSLEKKLSNFADVPEMEFEEIFKIREEGLELMKKIYYEFDDHNITFCTKSLMALLIKVGDDNETTEVVQNKEKMKEVALDLERRMKVTIWEESFAWKTFKEMVEEMGIDLRK